MNQPKREGEPINIHVVQHVRELQPDFDAMQRFIGGTEMTERKDESASWVIVHKASGDVVMETFSQRMVAAINREKYDAVPILTYLQQFNAKVAG